MEHLSLARWRELNPLTGELSTFCAIRFAPITLLPFRAYRLGRQSQWNTRVFSSQILVCWFGEPRLSERQDSNLLMCKFPEAHPPRPTLLRRLCVAGPLIPFAQSAGLAVGIRRLSVSIPLIRYRSDIPPADKVSFDMQRILL